METSKLIDQGSEWDFALLHRTHDAIEQIAIDDLGLDVYRNQIEVITSEQMLDAYAAIGMPLCGLGLRFLGRARLGRYLVGLVLAFWYLRDLRLTLMVLVGGVYSAGICLALATFKPQMAVIIVPFVLLWGLSQRRRGVLSGFGLSMFALLGLAFLLQRDWLLPNAAQMLAYGSYTPPDTPAVPSVR